MRATDLARLNQPYPEHADPLRSGARAALGMELPRWSELEKEVFADFASQPPYGIGWWATSPGTSRRILIADQLYCCLKSAADNMVESSLHWLEFLDASDRENERIAEAVKIENGQEVFSPPPPRNPLEELGLELIRIQYAGVVRALASALDCLAGVVIGVAALPIEILRADFKGARKEFSKIRENANDGAKKQAQFAARLESNIADAGPPGWLDWTLDFRNMLVHRGRRIELGQIVTRALPIYGPDAWPVIRTRRVTHLPRDPGRSDVEVFLDAPWTLVLDEEAEKTLGGLMRSTTALLETTARDLLKLWNWRRENPRGLQQPAKQWPKGRATQSTGFNGYAPGSLKLAPNVGMVHPDTARRFASAALDDRVRAQWPTFD